MCFFRNDIYFSAKISCIVIAEKGNTHINKVLQNILQHLDL